MTRPRTWAPAATSLDFIIDGQRLAGELDSDGWWRCPRDVVDGAEIRVAVEGADPLPDPRAIDLPSGLDGPARVFDPTDLPWTDSGFRPTSWDHAVLYELHVGTFTEDGTFDAAIERLDHLAALGVSHIEVLPVNVFAGARGWGYDGVYLYGVHPAYGGPTALARFIDAAHARGLAVLMDVVYNHVGPGSERLSAFGPYFAAGPGTPWGPRFDFDNAEVRRFVVDNALMWLRDFHCDGLRLDAVQTIVDDSDPHILAQLADEVRALEKRTGRSHVLIAETILNERHMVRPRSEGGHGLDAHWHEDFHHALHAALTGERAGYYADFGPLGTLAHVLEHGYWFDGTRLSLYHQRAYGEAGDGLHGRELVAYLQTHDQAGNRADGARIGALATPEAVKLGAALTLLGPCVPMLFQGEEWGATTPFHFFCDHPPPRASAVREGRRGELEAFGFDASAMLDPNDAATMRACVLRWDELDRPEHAAMLQWMRSLIQLRHERGLDAAPLADVQIDFDEDRRWLKMQRGPVEVHADFAGPSVSIIVDGETFRPK